MWRAAVMDTQDEELTQPLYTGCRFFSKSFSISCQFVMV